MNKSPSAAKNDTDGARPARSIVVTVLYHTCVWFTAVSLGILLVRLLLSLGDADLSSSVLFIPQFLCLFPFSLCAALAGAVRRTSWPAAGRLLLHMPLSLGGALLCIYLPLALTQEHTGAQALRWVLLFLVVYAVGLVIYLLVTRRKRRAREEKIPYESQFKKR